MASHTLGVIPARLNSSRLPGKLLLPIAGKPLLWHTFHRAQKSKLIDDLIIATDSPEIRDVAQGFGATVIMTSARHRTGSDRIVEAVKKYRGKKPDIVVNIQGDEPMIHAKTIDAAVSVLRKHPEFHMAGVANRTADMSIITPSSVVKLVVDKNQRVLLLSRAVIPFDHTGKRKEFLHILGLMAYRADFLNVYAKLPQRPLELAESIEQLRILEHGYTMGVAVGRYQELGVNTQDEYDYVRQIIEKEHGKTK